jgi:hypothetical protein
MQTVTANNAGVVARDSHGHRVAQIVYDPPQKCPCVMIDIETLATTDDAVILDIGAVCFDRENRIAWEGFSMTLDYLSQGNRKTDLETVMWWLAPERISRFREITDDHERNPGLWHGLSELKVFLERHLAPKGEVWAKGDFDLRILGHAFRQHDMELPWKYYQARELRTVLKWMDIHPSGTVQHSAVQDARLQIESLFAAEAMKGLPDSADFGRGWMAYRENLAETRGMLLPAWGSLDGEVRESWCAGVHACLVRTQSAEDLEP